MKTETKSFSFRIPEDSPQFNSEADEKNQVVKDFEFQVCETEAEAIDTMAKKEWKLLDLVNDLLKANARSNAYQTMLVRYRPSQVPKEDIVERMVRDYMRLGVSEDAARKQVIGMLGLQTSIPESVSDESDQ